MDIKELEKIAHANKESMPDNLSMQEQILFQGLRYMYMQHKIGAITTQQASDEKMKLISEFNRAVAKEKARLRDAFHTVAMWKAIELTLSAYQKDKTIENADKLAKAIDGQVHGWEEMRGIADASEKL